MGIKRRKLLVIGVDPEEYERVVPFLDRESFDVDRFPSAHGAMELLAEISFEMLIVRYPLPDMQTYSFVEGVRGSAGPCVGSPIILLAAGGDREEAATYVGRGVNRLVHLEESKNQIQRAVSELLAVAPRKAARFLARLEIKLGGAKDMILCETENLSATGMLIRTDRRYQKGTKVSFEFSLPDHHRPVVGFAEIMRHTMNGRDIVGGIGVRFLSFVGDSQRRFESYLQDC
jgi:response regulator RpfG family c-di-GMP phosphodiesterase